MKTEPNKQKLMSTRTGQIISKPRVRKRKGGGHPFPWETQEVKRPERTTWFNSVCDLFRSR